MSEILKPVNIIEQARKNWVVVVFIVSLIVGWTNIQSDLKKNQEDIVQIRTDNVALAVKLDATQKDLLGIAGDIKEINASLSFIRATLTK